MFSRGQAAQRPRQDRDKLRPRDAPVKTGRALQRSDRRGSGSPEQGEAVHPVGDVLRPAPNNVGETGLPDSVHLHPDIAITTVVLYQDSAIRLGITCQRHPFLILLIEVRQPRRSQYSGNFSAYNQSHMFGDQMAGRMSLRGSMLLPAKSRTVRGTLSQQVADRRTAGDVPESWRQGASTDAPLAGEELTRDIFEL